MNISKSTTPVRDFSINIVTKREAKVAKKVAGHVDKEFANTVANRVNTHKIHIAKSPMGLLKGLCSFYANKAKASMLAITHSINKKEVQVLESVKNKLQPKN